MPFARRSALGPASSQERGDRGQNIAGEHDEVTE
jgi:hypothetical protein